MNEKGIRETKNLNENLPGSLKIEKVFNQSFQILECFPMIEPTFIDVKMKHQLETDENHRDSMKIHLLT